MNIRKNNELRNVLILILVGLLLALAAACASAANNPPPVYSVKYTQWPATPVGSSQTNWTGPMIPSNATEYWAVNSLAPVTPYVAPVQDPIRSVSVEKRADQTSSFRGYGYRPAIRYPGSYYGYYDDGYGFYGSNYRFINPNRVRVYSNHRNGIVMYGGISARWNNYRGWRPAYDPHRYRH